MVQVAHACLAAGREFAPPDGAHLVLLRVADEAALLHAVEEVGRAGVSVQLFYEPDFPRGFTAACSGPVYGAGRRVFRRFALWR